jgi:hypothetical protein
VIFKGWRVVVVQSQLTLTGGFVTGKLTAPLWGWIGRWENEPNYRRIKERHVGECRLGKESND